MLLAKRGISEVVYNVYYFFGTAFILKGKFLINKKI